MGFEYRAADGTIIFIADNELPLDGLREEVRERMRQARQSGTAANRPRREWREWRPVTHGPLEGLYEFRRSYSRDIVEYRREGITIQVTAREMRETPSARAAEFVEARWLQRRDEVMEENDDYVDDTWHGGNLDLLCAVCHQRAGQHHWRSPHNIDENMRRHGGSRYSRTCSGFIRPVVREADPELERLLAEEERIERELNRTTTVAEFLETVPDRNEWADCNERLQGFEMMFGDGGVHYRRDGTSITIPNREMANLEPDTITRIVYERWEAARIRQETERFNEALNNPEPLISNEMMSLVTAAADEGARSLADRLRAGEVRIRWEDPGPLNVLSDVAEDVS